MPGHERFDHVIVGAGSAGCVLAHRLSAGGTHRVCLRDPMKAAARLLKS